MIDNRTTRLVFGYPLLSIIAAIMFSAPSLVLSATAVANDDFRVNDTVSGFQDYTGVAMDEDGGFMIVYTSEYPTDDDPRRILGKRYDAAGGSTGGEILLSTNVPIEGQRNARICRRPDGGWVVAYHNDRSFSVGGSAPVDREGVFARFLADDGTPEAGEFQVSSAVVGSQGSTDLDVACLPDGGFFAAWGDDGQDGSSYGIFGQRIDENGAAVGGEIQVNTETEGSQGNYGGVEVEAAADGTVLVMWSSNCPAYVSSATCSVEPDGSASSAQARLFNPDGVALGNEFRLNTTTLGSQGSHGLAAAFDADGNFLAVYYSGDVSATPCKNWMPCGDLLGQRFDSTGTPIGTEIAINSALRRLQLHPAVAADGEGGYFVVWQHAGQAGTSDPDQIAGRHFDASGTPSGGEFRVTSNEPADDRNPIIAGIGGNYIVAWTVFSNYWGDGRDVAARTLSSDLPICPPAPSDSCFASDESKLSFAGDSKGGGKLKWKWSRKSSSASVDPIGGMLGVALCIYDEDDDLILSDTVEPFANCGGKPCWKGRRGRATFKRKDATAFAMRSVKLQSKTERSRVAVKAGGADSPMPDMTSVSAPVVTQIVSNQGDCWRADYDVVEIGANSLRAKHN